MFSAGREALIRLSAHQEECTKRYDQIRQSLDAMKSQLEKNHAENKTSIEENAADSRRGRKAIYLLLWGVASAVILGLLTAVIWLLMNIVQFRVPVS